ncbi:MAG: hypothetical protein AAF587_03525 [Bacteroidota bacterium]
MNCFRVSLYLLFLFLFACQPAPSSDTSSQDFDPTAPASGEVEHVSTKDPDHGQGLSAIPPQPQSIHGQPVSVFLDNPEVAEDAIAFFKGEWRAGQDDRTVSLLKIITDSPEALRPFYFYLMDRIVQESNGSLSEELGIRLMGFVRDHPAIFAQHFAGQSLDGAPLIAHASLIGYELVLQQYPMESYDQLGEHIQANCASCAPEEMELLNDFLSKVKEVIQLQSEDLEESSE